MIPFTHSTKYILRFLYVCLVLALLVSWSFGCSHPPECDALLELPVVESDVIARSVPVEIYIDATPSMQGYLGGPYFARLVGDHLTPTNAAYEAFKVSRRGPHTMIERASLLDARNRDFYSTGDTDLVAAVDSSDRDKLSVLVTDLFQTDANTAELSNTISAKYLAQGLGVGLLAFVVNFDGTVYDVEGASFSYSGERPLYLILLGPVEAIERYREELLKNIDMAAPEFMLITKKLAASPVTLRSLVAQENIVLDSKLGSAGLLFETGAATASFTVPVDLKLREAVPSLSGTRAVTAGVETCGGNVPDNAMSVVAETMSDSIMLTSTLQNGNVFPENGYTRFRVRLEPTDLKVPAWVSERDMDLAELREWKADPGSFDGTKTLGLRPFVQRLLNATMQPPLPVLGEVYVVIDRD